MHIGMLKKQILMPYSARPYSTTFNPTSYVNLTSLVLVSSKLRVYEGKIQLIVQIGPHTEV